MCVCGDACGGIIMCVCVCVWAYHNVCVVMCVGGRIMCVCVCVCGDACGRVA